MPNRRLRSRVGLPCLLVILAASAPGRAAPPPIQQRQADCARPQYASDILVCGDPDLAALDREVGAAALALPPLAAGARWEDQSVWFRRRGLCAFQADHRGCLIAAYRDRRTVLRAVAAPAAEPLRCAGDWAGRPVVGSGASPGQAVTLREHGLLLGVATPGEAPWRPALAWRATGRGIALRGLDGARLVCRPAPP